MRKVGRRALVITCSLYIAAALVVIVGSAWAYLDHHDYFSDSVRRDRCVQNLARIDRGKDEFRAMHSLTNGTAVETDQFIEFVEGGWNSLKCPSGGAYTLGAIGEKATCSVHK